MSTMERGSLAAGPFACLHRPPFRVGGSFPSLSICSLDFLISFHIGWEVHRATRRGPWGKQLLKFVSIHSAPKEWHNPEARLLRAQIQGEPRSTQVHSGPGLLQFFPVTGEHRCKPLLDYKY